MPEISNKLVMRVLIVALIVIVTSVIITTSKISLLQERYSFFTGAATSTATGQTNLTITSSTSLTNQKFLIDFGSGSVNGSCEFCQMDSNGVYTSVYSNGSNSSTDGACCTSWNYSQTAGFLLENTGNNNLSVGYTCSGNCTYGLFIGGSRPGGFGGLEIKVTSNNVAGQTTEAGGTDGSASCVGGGALYRGSSWNITNSSAYSFCSGTGGNVVTGNCTGTPQAVYTALSSRGHWLCGNYTGSPLMPDNTKDAAVVDINVSVASDSPATSVRSSFILTFNGTSQ